ncbi:phosphotyrosine protein phosphatase [Paraurantiacibacter namhicola]|uniref:Uncharacterized protein n=1 Tax=Paraurantiacibacter namhicola TaxID=645517 RepID=A0A1C7DB25_9SPHN|nr:phosphotyrosine protein phosphatase [Paraurantiacibacter namhicola]ANU08658.1 hypothetical protein A6F65_02375 [Paraurantiacibacter namhicola]
MDVLSAGIASDADTPIDAELVAWADRIFVMEKRQAAAIRGRFPEALGDTWIVCLAIPDRYRFMQPELVERIERAMEPFAPS